MSNQLYHGYFINGNKYLFEEAIKIKLLILVEVHAFMINVIGMHLNVTLFYLNLYHYLTSLFCR